MKKRFLAALLALAMALALLPTTAFAAGESGIQLGTSGLGTDDTVYFGTYGTTEVPWYVLNTNEFLLSKYTIGTSSFRDLDDWGYYNYSTNSGTEDSSNLKDTMDGLYNGSGTLFSGLEQGAITETTLTGNSMFSGMSNVTAHLFPLSYDEAYDLTWGSDKLIAKSITAPEGSAGWWWLRSSYDDYLAFCVDGVGHFDSDLVNSFHGHGVRPAFNLNLNSVLFTSAAVGGKSSGAEGAGALNLNLTPSGATAWKLTLKDYDGDNEADGDRDGFTIYTTAVSGRSFTLRYSGAKTGTKEYLSAMIVDSGSVAYYGRILQLDGTTNAASGTAAVNVPTSVTLDSDTVLYVFNEQYNDDKNTDYSSALRQVSLTVNEPTATVGNVTVSGTTGTLLASQTATITLTNDTFTNTSYANCASWFTNLPTDITASATVTGGNVATITFGGTPTATSTAVMAITIPSTALTGGTALTVTANADAKYNIVASTPPQPPVDPDPTITDPVQAKTVTATVGSTATFSVQAQNATRYQWQKSTDGGRTWNNINPTENASAATPSYTTSTVTMAHNGYQYRCIVSGAAGTTPITSSIFTLNVIEQPDIPATGDSAMPGLWIGIMMLAGMGLLASVVLGRRKRHSN